MTPCEFGRLDVVVLNAAYQKNRESFESLPTEEFDRVFKTNLYSLLWTARAAVPHLTAGASIITTASIQAFNPSPGLIDYAMTKAAQVAFTKALAQELGPKGIRVNAVAPGPIWTPLIPATEWPDKLPSLARTRPCGGQASPPSWHRPTSCWHPTQVVHFRGSGSGHRRQGALTAAPGFCRQQLPAISSQQFPANQEEEHDQDKPAPSP